MPTTILETENGRWICQYIRLNETFAHSQLIKQLTINCFVAVDGPSHCIKVYLFDPLLFKSVDCGLLLCFRFLMTLAARGNVIKNAATYNFKKCGLSDQPVHNFVLLSY